MVVVDGKEEGSHEEIPWLWFSPDSRRVAYAAERQGKFLIVVDGTEGQWFDDIYNPVFSPDGQHVAYVAGPVGNRFAVVDGDGTLRASRGVQSAGHSVDASGNPLKGSYRVLFNRNVSLCAVTVTAEPSFSGQITASVNGTFRGIPNPNPNFPPNQFIIVLFDEDHDFVDSRFNIIVTC